MAKKRSSSSNGRKSVRPADATLEARAQPFLKRIEKLLDDLESKRGSYMASCRPVHEDISEIYGEAKQKGIPVKALKGLVKWRVLERKQEKIADDFEDIDEKASYDQLVEKLGPLGFAAAVAAGYRKEEPAQEEDLRPRHLQQAEQERADEANLEHVGRGPVIEGEPPVEAAAAH